MEVRNNINSVSFRGPKRQTFGSYIGERQITRALESQVNGVKKYFTLLDKNNGENLNNIVTAVGTAGVAPIFIRYNPLSNEDPKVKSYSALRQPLSAVLALSVQLPAMTIFNHGMNKLAASGKIRRIDLSCKPPHALLSAYAKAEYNHHKQMAIEGGKDFEQILNGRSKVEFLQDIMNDKRNELFYARRDRLRELAQNNLPITTAPLYDANGKLIKLSHPVKLSEIKDLEFVKPKELEDASKSVYASVLKEFGLNPDDKKLFKIKMDYMAEDPKAKFNRLSQAEIVPESEKEYLTGKVKSELKKAGKSYKEFKKTLSKRAEVYAIDKVKAEIKEKAHIKLEVSKALDEMNVKFANIKEKIYHNREIPMADKAAKIKEAELQLIQDKIAEFAAKKGQADDYRKIILEGVIKKLDGKSLNDIRHHGTTFNAALTSVKAKRWLLAEINRREGVFSNAKKLTGLVYGLAILPFTCGLLNWAYPRFMEKFFPELCTAKKKAKAAKYAEINGTIPAQKLEIPTPAAKEVK